LPNFYFCQVGLSNCWRLIFLILPKLYGCKVRLPDCWSCSTANHWETNASVPTSRSHKTDAPRHLPNAAASFLFLVSRLPAPTTTPARELFPLTHASFVPAPLPAGGRSTARTAGPRPSSSSATAGDRHCERPQPPAR
jgi:hypothetical protein